MKLEWIDFVIIITYLIGTLLIGWLLRKKASISKENYLLGGKSLPWYLLSLSNASDMFDVSGTMWMVTLCFVYGVKSIWIPWLWPSFNTIFMMMFLSKWLRRSNATTGAEWLATRFGTSGKGVKASHNIVVAFALLSCFGFLVYGFIGLGKFVEIFIPWHIVQPYIPFTVSPLYVPHFYGTVFTLFAAFYAVVGGMHSIVIGDLVKYAVMVVACISIAVIAMLHLHSNTLPVPHGWRSPFFGKMLHLDWSHIIPDVNKKIREDGFSFFSIFFMMMTFKGFIASLTGPTPNYDMQKVLSTRSPKEASKMSGFMSLFLYPIRYAMITGVTVLALLYYHQLNLATPAGTDFERILPAAINSFLPDGILGIVLTSLLGAFMGTFSGTLNAAQAYIINDIYLKFINPHASTKRVIAMNYLVGSLIVVISICLGFFVKNINSALQWIANALYGGYIAANVLKWIWWRFNANGFFWGMASGIAAALVLPYCKEWFPGVFFQLDLYNWPILFFISLIGCIVGTYAAPPTEINLLKSFYATVRPWGFWQPVYQLVRIENPSFLKNKDFRLDMFNVVIGVIGQCCLALLPMYLILWSTLPFILVVIILIIITLILKKTWWNRLEN
jgi:SSS family solute:Na+ symporter